MKIIFHPDSERGGGDYGWLSTRYSFSFNTWYDESRMGFGALRVLNDDVIAAGKGFGYHGHRDMEIITIVMKGAVSHQDSMGNAYIVEEGDVQVMSAGTGVMHAESNASADVPLELFQIWIEPKEYSLEPRYEQKHYDFTSITNTSVELVGESSLMINQDAYITYGSFEKGKEYKYQIKREGNGVYVFVISGVLRIGNDNLKDRDALGITDLGAAQMLFEEDSVFLVIEVPMK